MRRTNIEFMIGWLDALRRDDLDAVRGMLDDAIVWQGVRDEWTCRGPDAVASTFAQERDARAEIERLELIGAARHAVLHAAGAGVTAVLGVPLPDGIYNVFAIDAGKVTRIDDFADRRQALAVAGLPA
jgi:hypothetical protein